MTTMRDGRAVLFLRMPPLWSTVDGVRRLVESFCASAAPDAARDEQLALAAHELLQNAFAGSPDADVELEAEIDRRAGRIRVSVTNACEPAHIPALVARVARVQAHRTPLAAHLEALRDDPQGHGGVGLSRIRYEAELDLRIGVDGARVTIHAEGPLFAPGPAAPLDA